MVGEKNPNGNWLIFFFRIEIERNWKRSRLRRLLPHSDRNSSLRTNFFVPNCLKTFRLWDSSLLTTYSSWSLWSIRSNTHCQVFRFGKWLMRGFVEHFFSFEQTGANFFYFIGMEAKTCQNFRLHLKLRKKVKCLMDFWMKMTGFFCIFTALTNKECLGLVGIKPSR